MKKEETNNNIEQFALHIAEKGIVVLDNITKISMLGKPYVSDCLVIGICHSGFSKAKYDMNDYSFQAHDIAVIYPLHVVLVESVSSDFRTSLLVLSPEAFATYKASFSFRSRSHYEQYPGLHLNDQQFAAVTSIVDSIRAVGNCDIPSRKVLMISLLEVLLRIKDHYSIKSKLLNSKLLSQGVSFRFFENVVEYHRKSHSVNFYADKLCLSPKHFSHVIKQETGYGAKYWINAYIIREAKSLLHTRRDLNIHEISEYLGFEDQSSFCRLFKVLTGLSPTEFRQKYSEI
jgi:AraC-like DNA-binding protein